MPGLLHLRSSPSPTETSWSGTLTYILKTPHVHVASSSMHPAVGLEYLPFEDTLLMRAPGEEMTCNTRRISEKLEYLNQVRTGPIGEEKREKDRDDKEKKDVRMTKSDANTTCAMSSYDGAGVMAWIHDGFAPLHILRPVPFHMRSRSLLDRLHMVFIRIFGLQDSDSTIMSDNIDVTAWKFQEISSQSLGARREFRESLTMHLFGWDPLMSLRMRLSLADYGRKLSEDPQKRLEYGNVAGVLLTAICHRNLRTMLKHLAAVALSFTSMLSYVFSLLRLVNATKKPVDDVPFVLRMVVRSLLPGAPPELSAEGENLSTIVHRMFNDQATGGLNELCPACHIQVSWENIVNAKCLNGHVWSLAHALSKMVRYLVTQYDRRGTPPHNAVHGWGGTTFPIGDPRTIAVRRTDPVLIAILEPQIDEGIESD
ncbi:hypothetical protein PQX77_005400 [Marasmius sp. AFHP31]|nr:hypothetical protein PQX77_005400 [Marasmius sp. AFHP31]